MGVNDNEKPGILYVVATPIGNLGDLSPRAGEALGGADIIAAEDTRVSRKLLAHLDIHKSLLSYHEHNRLTRGKDLLEALKKGNRVALVTDAGTPCLSDPGEELVRLACEAGIKVVPVPGPSAVAAALMVSGLSGQPFYFHGFLDRERAGRRKEIRMLATLTATLVFFEAPHRVLKTLEDLALELGNRKVAVCRELTKFHEEVIRGKLEEVRARMESAKARGEYTLVIEGAPPASRASAIVPLEISVEEHLASLIGAGRSLNQAIAEVARTRNLPRGEVYRIGHSLGDKCGT